MVYQVQTPLPGLFMGVVGEALVETDYALWINCTHDVSFPSAVPIPARVRVPVLDNFRDPSQPERLMLYLPTVIHAIHSHLLDGDRVLLWSRSAQHVGTAIAAAYIMWSEETGYDVGISKVRASDPLAFVWRSGMVTALNKWLNYLRAIQLVNNAPTV